MVERFAARLGIKRGGFLHFPVWKRHSYQEANFRLVATEGYKRHSVVMACLQVHQDAVGEPPLEVCKRNEAGKYDTLPDHWATRLLRRPNPFMGQSEFWGTVVTYAALGGSCYVWKERSVDGSVIGLWPLHDAQVAPVPDPTGYISHYAYSVDMASPEGDAGHTIEIRAGDIVQIKWAPDPLEPLRGLSPLVAAYRDVDIINLIQRYTYSLLKNDATPRTVLVANTALSDKQYDRLLRSFEQYYGGQNLGRPILLEGDGARVERMSAGLGELAVEGIYFVPQSNICACLKVPAQMVGVNVGLARSTYANMEEARAGYTRDFRVPFWRRAADQFSMALLEVEEPGAMDSGLCMRFDLRQVEALRAVQLATIATVAGAVNVFMTANEARGEVGLPPLDGLDEIKEPPPPPAPMQTTEEPAEEQPPAKKSAGWEQPDRDVLAQDVVALIEAELQRIEAVVAERRNGRASETV